MMFMLDWLLDIQYIYCGTIIKSYEGIFLLFHKNTQNLYLSFDYRN